MNPTVTTTKVLLSIPDDVIAQIQTQADEDGLSLQQALRELVVRCYHNRRHFNHVPHVYEYQGVLVTECEECGALVDVERA